MQERARLQGLGRNPAALIAGFAVTLLAAFLRLINLGNPKTIVFDETYYVKDAFSLLKYGTERKWDKDTNALFALGDTSGLSDAASFVVHPPLGKWIIALGIQLFGVENAFSWRVTTAIIGVFSVILVMLVAHRILRSAWLAVAAGFLMAIDGIGIVLSRTALLDNHLAFFVLLAFYFLLLDREQSRFRVLQSTPPPTPTESREATGASLSSTEGPQEASQAPMASRVFWFRPWLIAAGLALGAATAVKWSGLYVIAVFGIYLVASEALYRRKLGQWDWLWTGGLRQGFRSFVNLVPVSIAVYLVSWTGWLVTQGGWKRDWADNPENQAEGFWSWVPLPLQSLWEYHREAYNFHVNLTDDHGYQANPLLWLAQIRPTAFFYEGRDFEQEGCLLETGCSKAIHALGNPTIWWVGLIVILLLWYRALRHYEETTGLVLIGIVATYLPWMLYLHRTVFNFYSIAILPFLTICILYLFQLWYRRTSPGRRPRVVLVGGLLLLLAAAMTAFFWPVWVGDVISYQAWTWRMWLPSWV